MTRTIKVYDYANNAVDIDIPDKEITAISVVVICGDETGIISFADGTSMTFTSCEIRPQDIVDRIYVVTGKRIKEWINFIPTPDTTFSYERASIFEEEDSVVPPETQKISEDMRCGQPFLSQAGQWICTEPGNYVFFDKTTDKVWRVTEITDEIVFEEE